MMTFQDHCNQIQEQETARQGQSVQIIGTVQNREPPRDVQDPELTYTADQLEKQGQDQKTEAKKDPELLQSEIQNGKNLDEPPTKNQDREEHLHSSQGKLDAATQSQAPMPSDEVMRHSIADSLMEILVNMTNSHYRRECLELLEATDPLQARCQVLNILQRIDVERSSSSQ